VRVFSVLCLTGLLASASLPALAQDGFQTPARHAIIVDYETGQVLYEKDARRPAYPASMTKIMTAELVFNQIRSGAINMDTEFVVSENAWRKGGAASGGSTMFLELGSSVRVEDLLRGVIIQSGNDACIVLAEGIAGSEAAFADMMNNHARDIGLETAFFKNSTGLHDPEHVISLHDLSKLAHRTISDYQEFYSLYSERKFTWNKTTQGNRNPLLGRFDGADGLKTGYTEASGYGLVASAKRGDTRRIIAFNGLDSKAARSREGRRLMQLSVKVELPKEISAPIEKGQTIGTLIVKAPGMTDKRISLKAVNEVRRKSAIGRAGEALIKMFGG